MDTCFEFVRIAITCFLHIFQYSIGIQTYDNSVTALCNDLVHINVIYAKILQWDIYKIFGSNEHINNHLKQYNNNVPFDAEDDIDYTLLHQIKQYAIQQNRCLTLENEFIPINSGTVALVFKGMLDDKPVVIKILRKNIHDKIDRGIRTVLTIIKSIHFIASFFCTINDNTSNIIRGNHKILMQQLDFNEEIKNNELFAKISESYDFIKIPDIHKSFTTDVSNKIIVMEFFEGPSLTYLDNDSTFKHMYRDKIIKFILDSYVTHKCVHADLHTGNIIFTNEKIGLIDFGLVLQLTDKDAKHIVDIFFSIKNKNCDRLIMSIGKICSEDKMFLQQFRDSCASTNVLLPLLADNCACTSKVFADILQIFNNIQIPIESRGPTMILSIVSCFSMIELMGGKDVALDHVFKNFLK